MVTKLELDNGNIWYNNNKTEIKRYHLEYNNKTNGVTTTLEISIFYSNTNIKDEFIVFDLYDETSFDTYNDANTYALTRLKEMYNMCLKQELDLISYEYTKKTKRKDKGDK